MFKNYTHITPFLYSVQMKRIIRASRRYNSDYATRISAVSWEWNFYTHISLYNKNVDH